MVKDSSITIGQQVHFVLSLVVENDLRSTEYMSMIKPRRVHYSGILCVTANFESIGGIV